MHTDQPGALAAKNFFYSGPVYNWNYRMVEVLKRCGSLAFLILLAVCACSAQTNVLTYHNDNARTGQNLSETILSPSNVNSTKFGNVGFLPVQGLVDAEPLYVANLTVAGASHNVLFVVTEHDLVYAFDAGTFVQLWQQSVLGANETPSDDRGCDQVTPEIGITSTPVIDLAAGPHGTIFVVGMSKDSSGNYHHRLHALDLTTGSELPNSPTTIQATFPNSGSGVTFDPEQYKERAGLLLLNGVIYTGWASHCDYTPYTGWVMGYSESTLQQTSVLDFTPNGSDGAVWMSGAGMAADSSGNIYFLAANGTFDNTVNASGFPVNGDYGNAFMKLSTTGNVLGVADYFAMYDASSESAMDEDLGSGGAMLLPDLLDGSGNTHHLAVGAGKDGHIYVVNRDSMGKFNPSNDSAIYQEIVSNGLSAGVWAMPAYFNNTVYYGAQTDFLKAFQISGAKLVAPAASHSAASYAYPGTTPSISANGASNGIVWAVEDGTSFGVLHAYNAANLATELYNSNQAGTRDHFEDNKYITPMITNGKVYVGTPTGVMVFGLLPAISNVSAASITTSGATITWTTLVPSNSQVEYGTTTAYGSSTTLDTNLVTSHSEPLSGLNSGTLYHYRVHSTDGSGNASVSGDFTFTTITSSNNPPVISSVAAVNVTTTGAKITWTTDQASNSQVAYGTTTAYGSLTSLDTSFVTSHSQSLSGLTPGTLYHYQVLSANSSAVQGASGDFTFATTSASPTVITFDDISPADRVLTGQYPTGLINWGTGTNWWLSSPWGLFTTQSISFNGASLTSVGFTFVSSSRLLSLQAYNGGTTSSTITISCAGQPTVTAAVAAGTIATINTGWSAACLGVTLGSTNGWYTNFDNLTVDTPPSPGGPTITNVASGSITTTGATITWTTNVVANSQVEYGTTTSYGNQTALDTNLVTSHSEAVSGLTAGTLYHYRVHSADGVGNASVSGDFTFTTTSGPVTLLSVSVNPTSVNGGTSSTGTVTLSGPAPSGASVSVSSNNPAAMVPGTGVPVATNATTATFTITTSAVSAVTPVTITGIYNGGTPQTATLTINNPTITSVAAGSITSTGATITWTTNVTANSQVEYGTTTGYGTFSTLNSSLVTSHSVALSALTASTLYHYRVHSTDGAGNSAVSGDFTFTTTSGSVVTTTVTFDDISPADRVLSGQYPTGLINWGTGTSWWLSSAWGLFTTQSISFNGASLTSVSFAFVSSSHLVSLQAYNGGTTSSTITISCTGQTTVTAAVAAGVISTINTKWTTPCTPVTIKSSNGWNTNFDNMAVSTP